MVDEDKDRVIVQALLDNEKTRYASQAVPGHVLEVTWDLYVYIHDVLEENWKGMRDVGYEEPPPHMHAARYCGLPIRQSLVGSMRARVSRDRSDT